MRKVTLLVVLFSFIILMSSCSKPAEVTVKKYFQTMSHNDKDSMASMAIEPKHLEFKSFEITDVAEPVVTDFELPAMMEKLNKIDADRKGELKKAREKNDELLDLKDELEETRSRAGKNRIKAKIKTVEEEIEEIETAYKALLVKKGKMKKVVEFERNLINLSANIKKNAEIYEGKTHNIKVVVKVTFENDDVKDYVFLLRSYEFIVNEKVLPNRLIILNILTQEEFDQLGKAETEVPVEEEASAEETQTEQPE